MREPTDEVEMMRPRTPAHSLLFLSAALVAGCTTTPDEGNPFGSGSGAGGTDGGVGSASGGNTTDGTGGSGGEATTGDTGDGDTTDGGGLKFDTPDGQGTATAGDGEGGCTAVDVLFVVDNSSSMCSYQAALADAFPGFVDAMYDNLPDGTDLHVAVTSSSFATGGSHGESNCAPGESLGTIQSYYHRPTEQNVAGNGFQGRLYEYEGQSYFAADTSDLTEKDDLESWFTGAATGVGCEIGSAFEFPSAGAAWAVHESNAANNDGFLRDEGAVLLIFILSDEADQSTDVEDMSFLRDTVLQAKAGCGGDQCIVTGGLLNQFCVEEGKNNAYQFLSSFGEEPSWGDIQGGDWFNPDFSKYPEVVGDALAGVLAETCEQIPPVG